MHTARTSEDLRVHNRIRLLRAVHDGSGSVTRSRLTRQLGMARGTASVLVTQLHDDRLIAETPAGTSARGRPTQIPGPHPHGPVALTVEVREDGWDIGTAELGGEVTAVERSEHDGRFTEAFDAIAAALRHRARALNGRAVGAGISVAGPVRDGRMVHISHLGWQEVDVAGFLDGTPIPVQLGNDATLAGIAEARRGALRGTGTGLHLHVDFDIGGSLLVDGRPVDGARGVAGEYGHMPLTGNTDRCLCGAVGCWSLDVGTNALLRHTGRPADYRRGRQAAREVLARADSGDPGASEAIRTVAAHLGTGMGALCNALDPEAISLSGFAVELHRRAADVVTAHCSAGLMDFHKGFPPRIEPSIMGASGPLVGAAELVWDAFLTPEGLRTWTDRIG